MKYITSKQAKEIDRYAQEEFNIPSIILMENAGRAIAQAAADMLSDLVNKNIACVCGKGNNAGDGFVAARHLTNRGISVKIFLIAEENELKADAAVNLRIIRKMGLKIVKIAEREGIGLFKQAILKAGLLIDAIFGIGLKGVAEYPYDEIIELMNSSGKPILAIDVPSGLDATSGRVLGKAIKAAKTVTFVLPKTGFIINAGSKYAGAVLVADISIPRNILDDYLGPEPGDFC